MNYFVLIFTALAVFFLSSLIIAILRRAYATYEETYLAKQITDLSEMFFFIGPLQLLTLTLAISAIGLCLGLLLMGPIMTIILTLLGLFTPTLLVRFYRLRRIQSFERQLVDALGAMASALRAGMNLHQAMEEISKNASAPLAQEFSLTVRQMRLGNAAEEALENMNQRVKSSDLALVVTSINVSRSLGGNMAELLDKLATTMRERFRIEGKISALTAQGKLQGWIIGAMPLLVWVLFDWLRPDLTRPMLEHWFGYSMLGLIIFMQILGALFIRRVVGIKV